MLPELLAASGKRVSTVQHAKRLDVAGRAEHVVFLGRIKCVSNPLPFRFVHRQVGAAKNRANVGTVERIKPDAYAGAYLDPPSLDHERTFELAKDSLGHVRSSGLTTRRRQNDGELVTSQSGNKAVVACH